MLFSYHTERWLPHPVERVFNFFVDPDNLPLLMPRWQGPRIENVSILPPPRETGSARPPTVAAGVGTRLTLSFRPFPLSPLRIHWESEITEFSWNHRFCDEQIRGPFSSWKHCHTFSPSCWHGVDATLVADTVEYEVPFGSMGRLAHLLFLRGEIEHTFAYRQRRLEKILASIKSQSPRSKQDWAVPPESAAS